MSFSDPKVATFIERAFVPVRFSLVLEGEGADEEGRTFVRSQLKDSDLGIVPPPLFVVSPEREILGSLSFAATAEETLSFLREILEKAPNLAPSENPIADLEREPQTLAERRLADFEQRWKAGDRSIALAEALKEFIDEYEAEWNHGTAVARNLYASVLYSQRMPERASAVWRDIVEHHPAHPLSHRASYLLSDITSSALPKLAEVADGLTEEQVRRPLHDPFPERREMNFRVMDTSADYLKTRSGIHLRRIPAGTFTMGGQPASFPRELPLRQVSISKDFLMAAYQVTQGLWREFRPDHEQFPGVPEDERLPQIGISHAEAMAFCSFLSERDGLRYRLPTEAEWEYAARGTIEGAPYPWGFAEVDDSRCNHRYFDGVPVASYEANGFGLFDLVGNGVEWTADYYLEDAYSRTPAMVTDPLVSREVIDSAKPNAEARAWVQRGGWAGVDFCRHMCRNALRLSGETATIRLVAELP